MALLEMKGLTVSALNKDKAFEPVAEEISFAM